MESVKMRFDSFWSEIFVKQPFFQAMLATKEDSPWHREESVAEHTRMALRFYQDNFFSKRTELQRLFTMLTLSFHDVGKPPSRQVKFKPERGEYNSFGGHELVSARLFEDFMSKNWTLVKSYFPELDWRMIYAMTWIIEQHKPWDLKKMGKLDNLRIAAHSILYQDEMFVSYLDQLMSDANGRISEDITAQNAKSDEWVQEFANMELKHPYADFPVENYTEGFSSLVILVGPSGAGKSTFKKSFLETNPDYVVYSLDDLRLNLYRESDGYVGTESVEEEYRLAFDYAVNNPSEFSQLANKAFSDLLRESRDILLDNTNVSTKARRAYLPEARRRGYLVSAILFPVDLETVLERQSTRTDKSVPADAVRRQYYQLSVPTLGAEVDLVDFHLGNLK